MKVLEKVSWHTTPVDVREVIQKAVESDMYADDHENNIDHVVQQLTSLITTLVEKGVIDLDTMNDMLGTDCEEVKDE